MACKVRTKRLEAVFNTIKALVKENSNITTLEDIDSWFKVNRPEVLPEEILDSLVATSPKKVNQAKKNIQKRILDLKNQGLLTNELETLLEKSVGKVGDKFPPLKEASRIGEIIRELTRVALSDQELSDIVFGDLISRLENINLLYGQSFLSKVSPETRTQAIKRAVENIKEIKKNMDISKLDSKVKDLQEKLADLDSDDFDVSSLLEPDTNVVLEAVDKEILIKEGQIQDLKHRIEAKINEVKLRDKSKRGIMGFDGKGAQDMRYLYERIKQEAWEAPRSLAFMGDLSAFGVQLAPVIASQSTRVNMKAMLNGDYPNVFASQKKMANIFNESVFQLFADEVRNNESNRSTKGLWARQKLAEIKQDPLYHIMKEAGLKISESKSLSESEEFYTSTLLNKVPFLGLLKDFSEDTMVTSLNMYRVQLFKEYYDMAGGMMTDEELKGAVEFINNLTGSTRVVTPFADKLMSAPKLLISRMRLAFYEPLKLPGRIDIKNTVKQRKLRWSSPTDAFIANKMLGIWRGYGIWFALLSQIPGIEFGEDPEESDFLRVRFNDTSVDMTGGIGSLYRMTAKIYTSLHGPTDNATFTAKSRAKYLELTKDWKSIALETLVGYRLHPTFGLMSQVYTGTDFFGQPYHEMFGPGEVSSRLEASIRSLMPISVETITDQLMFTPNSNFAEDAVISSLQIMGLNTFEYGDKSQDFRVRDYFNDIEYKPSIRYPKGLSKKAKSLEADFIKQKYREAWGNALGQLILDHNSDSSNLSKRQLAGKFKGIKAQLDRDFKEQYGDKIKSLEDK